jgi:hypothetical protein
MKKVVIHLKDGNFVNVEADTIELAKSYIIVKNGEKPVAIAKIKEIVSCHMSIQK